MTTLYVLKLKEGKYYVGTTNDVKRRMKEHFGGEGSQWTMKYKPIEVLSTREIDNTFEEDLETKRLMSVYGIDNVRGGAYSNIILTKSQLKALQHELVHASGKCFKCHQVGHFASSCRAASPTRATSPQRVVSPQRYSSVYMNSSLYEDFASERPPKLTRSLIRSRSPASKEITASTSSKESNKKNISDERGRKQERDEFIYITPTTHRLTSPKRDAKGSPKRTVGSPKRTAGSPRRTAGSPKRNTRGSPKRTAGSPRRAKSPKRY